MGKSDKFLRESLSRVHVYNSHLLAGMGVVFIEYHPKMPYSEAAWRVYKPGFRIAWEAGDTIRVERFRSFSFSRRADKHISLEEAKNWVQSQYGIAEWAKTPFDSYMEKETLAKRMIELLEAEREV